MAWLAVGLDEGVLRREDTGPNGATSLQDSMLDSVTVTLFEPKMNLVVNSAIHSPAINSDSYDTGLYNNHLEFKYRFYLAGEGKRLLKKSLIHRVPRELRNTHFALHPEGFDDVPSRKCIHAGFRTSRM